MNIQNRKNPAPTPAQRLQLSNLAERWEALFSTLMILRRLHPETYVKEGNTRSALWQDNLNPHNLAIGLIKYKFKELQVEAHGVHPDGLVINYSNIKNV